MHGYTHVNYKTENIETFELHNILFYSNISNKKNMWTFLHKISKYIYRVIIFANVFHNQQLINLSSL